MARTRLWNVRLTEEEHRHLRDLAARAGTNRSALVKAALRFVGLLRDEELRELLAAPPQPPPEDAA